MPKRDSATKRPNVLLVLTDDHAQWALGCYGNSEVRSASMDHLASTGVRMANAFTPSPVCSPARASLWTGKIPSQHGLHDYLGDAVAEAAARPWMNDHTTLADRFHSEGYTTGLVGKWHLGDSVHRPAGFDYWYVKSGPLPGAEGYESPWEKAPLDSDYNRHSIADHAVHFLRQRTQTVPFFLTVGFFATHSPWFGHAERLVELYRKCSFDDIPSDTAYPFGSMTSEARYVTRDNATEALAQYYAAVTEIDEQLGRILDELDSQGIAEDTVVVYTSDHGLNAGHHGIWGKGNATHPYNMVEESIRVPMLIKAPGRTLTGLTRAEPVTHCDLHLTLLDVAGITPGPDELELLPGRSFLGLCRGEALADWPDTVFGEYGDLRMARSGRFKLIMRYGRGSDQLFDLVDDPRETSNVATIAAYRPVLEGLRDRLTAFFDRYEDPSVSGLRVRDLAAHNTEEDWRCEHEHPLYEHPLWLEQLASSRNHETPAELDASSNNKWARRGSSSD